MVSMYEASSNMPRLQRKEEKVFLWRSYFDGILQTDRKVVERHGFEVQVCQYEEWVPRNLS